MPGDGKCIQIGTGKHGIQAILVFHQSAIRCFPVVKLTFDDPECVLHLTAHRGFTIFDISFPIDGIVGNPGQLAGTTVNAVVNAAYSIPRITVLGKNSRWIMLSTDYRAPLKTPPLRFGRIFRFNFAFRKNRNTPSIPDFPELNLKQNLSPKSSKKSF